METVFSDVALRAHLFNVWRLTAPLFRGFSLTLLTPKLFPLVTEFSVLTVWATVKRV